MIMLIMIFNTWTWTWMKHLHQKFCVVFVFLLWVCACVERGAQLRHGEAGIKRLILSHAGIDTGSEMENA